MVWLISHSGWESSLVVNPKWMSVSRGMSPSWTSTVCYLPWWMRVYMAVTIQLGREGSVFVTFQCGREGNVFVTSGSVRHLPWWMRGQCLSPPMVDEMAVFVTSHGGWEGSVRHLLWWMRGQCLSPPMVDESAAMTFQRGWEGSVCHLPWWMRVRQWPFNVDERAVFVTSHGGWECGSDLSTWMRGQYVCHPTPHPYPHRWRERGTVTFRGPSDPVQCLKLRKRTVGRRPVLKLLSSSPSALRPARAEAPN